MKQLLINAFAMNCVAHQSSGLWRHPRDRSREYHRLDHWLELARTLEAGMFDGLFLADVSGVYDVYGSSPDAALRNAMQIPTNDPFSIIPAMASVTEHLCFGVTGSIPYEPPYAFARRMSTLDHLTDGRLAWNVVTGYLDSAARGEGASRQQDHDTRYEIAEDYMQAMYKLWEGSWADDAVVFDRARGIFADPSRVREVHHDGPYFRVDGVHLCEPSPQRTPVIFQAGSSAMGQAFAAKHAECVFFSAPSVEVAQQFVSKVRGQCAEVGRDPQDLKMFALLAVVVDETDHAAQLKFEDYQSYGLGEGGLALLSGWTGIDLAQFDRDARADNLKSEGLQSAARALGHRTIEEWSQFMMVGGGARVLTGSAETIADELSQWVTQADIDGINLAYTVWPECFEDIGALLVPELQRRGLCKERHGNGTLRHRLFGQGDRAKPTHPSQEYRIT